ncbi:hypothetical protein CABS03_00945 [Colletotrichum abscissum]|uniref:Uncharacterized protein n=1 Tax=Colletotrichum abscissum TaxID=1671311 RepID=A0A9P9X8B0_9PEZI|nr:hypothetical protein CABS02_10281 [Colletotrichum abscissum]
MPMSRFPPVTLTLISPAKSNASPRAHLLSVLRTQTPNYRLNQGTKPCVRSLIRLSSRLTLFSVIGATLANWHSFEDAFWFIGHHPVFIFDHPQHPLSTLWLAQRSIAALRGSPAGCRRRNQPPFFPCPGRRRPSANRRTGCGQENHHPQVRTNKHRRRRANAPYPRRDIVA